MSGLIAVEESGDQLTEDEIVATCNLLLVAGHETTVNLIANAMLAMLRHPQHWAALSRDAGRAPAIVEETLRYDPPVQLVGRVAGDDMTINGVDIPKGDTMMLLLAAAHRDPAVIERPDEFDPGRACGPPSRVRPGPALLSRRTAGPAGGGRRADGGDQTFPGRATGGRTGLQAACHPPRYGRPRRRPLLSRPRAAGAAEVAEAGAAAVAAAVAVAAVAVVRRRGRRLDEQAAAAAPARMVVAEEASSES